MTDESKTQWIGGRTVEDWAVRVIPAAVIFADDERHVADLRRRACDVLRAFAAALSSHPTPAPVAGLDEIERLVREYGQVCAEGGSRFSQRVAALSQALDAIHALARDAGKVPDELRKLSDAAAGGVWFHEETDTRKRQYHIRSTLGQDTGGSGMRLFGGIQSEETASFVAAAVNFVHSLLAPPLPPTAPSQE